MEAIHRRNLNFYLCMYATCAAAANAYAPPSQILKIDSTTFSQDFLADCYKRVRKQYDKLADKFAVNGERDYDLLAKGPHLLKAVNAELKRRFNQKKKKT